MCYECGCKNPKTIMSDESITDETFRKAAEGAGVSLQEAKRNTLNLLKLELETPSRPGESREGGQRS